MVTMKKSVTMEAVKSLLLEWDGDGSGLEAVETAGGTLYKVADVIVQNEDIPGMTVTDSEGKETLVTDSIYNDMISRSLVGDGFAAKVAGYVYLAQKAAQAPGAELPAGGIWLLKKQDGSYPKKVVLPAYREAFLQGEKPDGEKGESMGGGSGGVTSWNDLKDRPFDKAVEEVRFVDNLTATSEYNSNYGAFCIYLEAALEQMPLTGNCKVAWDGVTRTHPIVEAEIQGEIYHGFGNLYMFSSFGLNAPNTGEPYAVLILPNRYAMVFTMDQSPAEHTVTVAADDAVYHPMDQRYLDIPTLDFVALGLSAIPQNQSEAATIVGDFTDIYETLLKNWVVKVRFDSQGSQFSKYNCVAFVNRHPDTAQFILTVFGYFTFKFTVTRSGIVGQYRGTL